MKLLTTRSLLEKVSNPSGILFVGLLATNGSDVLRVGQCDLAGIFQDIVHWYPVLAGRFHADICAGIGAKPPGEFSQAICEGREAAGPVSSNTPVTSRGNAGNNKLFVDIDSTADGIDDF
jgi:hypothetical protein